MHPVIESDSRKCANDYSGGPYHHYTFSNRFRESHTKLVSGLNKKKTCSASIVQWRRMLCKSDSAKTCYKIAGYFTTLSSNCCKIGSESHWMNIAIDLYTWLLTTVWDLLAQRKTFLVIFKLQLVEYYKNLTNFRTMTKGEQTGCFVITLLIQNWRSWLSNKPIA